MRRTPAASILALAVLWFCGSAPASEMYKWTDDQGVLHIATSLQDVPEQYRDQVMTMKAVAAPVTKPQPTNETPAVEPAQPAVEEPTLPRFEIPYQNEGSARRVIIPVKFNDSVTAPMALDTGSPGMVISLDLALRLRVFSRDSGTLFTEVGGIGGEALGILTIIDSVSVESARSVFVPTTVTAALSDKFDGLIGMDFLANHTISIDTKNQLVVFQETAPDPESRGGHDADWWRRTFEDFRAFSDSWRERAGAARSSHPGRRTTEFAEFQAREAERLFKRLDMYASDNAVPRHWR